MIDMVVHTACEGCGEGLPVDDTIVIHGLVLCPACDQAMLEGFTTRCAAGQHTVERSVMGRAYSGDGPDATYEAMCCFCAEERGLAFTYRTEGER